MKLKVYLIIVILLFVSSYVSMVYSQDSHCTNTEYTVFRCQVQKSEKVVSICISQPFSQEEGYIQYRFGKLGKVEFKYPKSLEKTQDKFYLETTHYVGGWNSALVFRNLEYTYGIYDEAIKVSPVEKDWDRGITISKENKTIADLKCRKGIQYNDSVNTVMDKVPTEIVEE